MSETNETTVWQDIDLCLKARVNVLLYGPPGTGKSYYARKAGLSQDQSCEVIHCTPDALGIETRGSVGPKPGSERWDWVDGPAIRAMRFGWRLVVEEVGRASDDLLCFLLACGDNPETAGISIPQTGELVRPKLGFHLVATSNQDPSELPEALRDRFLPVHVPYPHPAAWEGVPDLFRKVAVGDVEGGHSTLRDWLRLARMVGHNVPAPDALRLLFAERGETLADAVAMVGKGRGEPEVSDETTDSDVEF